MSLSARIEQILKSEPYLSRIKYGILIQDVKTGRTLYSKHPDAVLMPASNLKLLTAVLALRYLGPEHRFETAVYAPPIRCGSVTGNLLLRGSGDPSSLYDFFQPTVLPLEHLARQLKKKGLREIRGDVVADDSLFDRNWLGEGWKKDYLLLDYAPPTGALSLNGNVVLVTVTPRKVTLYPSAGSLRVINRSSCDAWEPLQITRRPGEDCIIIKGRRPSAGSISNTVTVVNPSLFTASAFARILRKNGIHITGKTRLIRLSDEKEAFLSLEKTASVKSPPLLDIVRVMNKESDNYIAQLLLKAVAARQGGIGSMEEVRKTAEAFFREAGVDPTGLYLADGCGLSRRNRITCRQMVGLLRYAAHCGFARDFYSTLPTGGEGTLEGRLVQVPLIAKTGSIEGTTALSGYLLTKSGRILAFAILVNNHPASCAAVREIQDRLIQAGARLDI